MDLAEVERWLAPVLNYIPQSAIGSRRVKPARLDARTIFAQRDGGVIREGVFSDEEQAIKPVPLSVRAEHLVPDATRLIAAPGFSGYPFDLLLAVNRDGTAAGTYMVKDVLPGAGSSTPIWITGLPSYALFVATDEAGIPDAVASQMADMFSGDIDFHRELRKGDRFSVVFESLSADGEPINWGQASGRVIAAEFVNNGKSHSAVW